MKKIQHLKKKFGKLFHKHHKNILFAIISSAIGIKLLFLFISSNIFFFHKNLNAVEYKGIYAGEITGAELDTDYFTPKYILTGLNQSGSILTISGAYYKINTGDWSDQPTIVYNGNFLQLKIHSATGYGEEKIISVKIDDVPVTRKIITKNSTGQILFSQIITGATSGKYYYSQIIPNLLFTGPVDVWIDTGFYSINGGDWLNTTGQLYYGDTLQIKLLAKSGENQAMLYFGSGVFLYKIISKTFNSGDVTSGDYNSGEYFSGYESSGNETSGSVEIGTNTSGSLSGTNYGSGEMSSGVENSGLNIGNYNSGFSLSGSELTGDSGNFILDSDSGGANLNSGDSLTGNSGNNFDTANFSGDFATLTGSSGSFYSGTSFSGEGENLESGNENSSFTGNYTSGENNSGNLNAGLNSSVTLNSGVKNINLEIYVPTSYSGKILNTGKLYVTVKILSGEISSGELAVKFNDLTGIFDSVSGNEIEYYQFVTGFSVGEVDYYVGYGDQIWSGKVADVDTIAPQIQSLYITNSGGKAKFVLNISEDINGKLKLVYTGKQFIKILSGRNFEFVFQVDKDKKIDYFISGVDKAGNKLYQKGEFLLSQTGVILGESEIQQYLSGLTIYSQQYVSSFTKVLEGFVKCSQKINYKVANAKINGVEVELKIPIFNNYGLRQVAFLLGQSLFDVMKSNSSLDANAIREIIKSFSDYITILKINKDFEKKCRNPFYNLYYSRFKDTLRKYGLIE